MGVTKQLAEFCAKLSYDDLPQSVIDATINLTLDFVGVTARGSSVPSSQIMLKTIKELSAAGEAATIGGGCTMAPQYAALVNGAFAHALDYDDVCNVASLHPAVAIFPAALAATQYLNGSGKDFILSVVLGYEVMCRLGKTLGPAKHYAQGFHPTATCGVFGAAAAAGSLLGLNADQMVDAFGVAGSQAAGSMEFLTDGTWTKRMHPGWAAHSGIIAALLARNGFKGPATIFEGKAGFLNAYSHDTRPEEITDALGSVFYVTKTSIKPYSCCRYIHAPMDAVFSILKDHHLQPGEIEQITIGLLAVAYPIVAEPEAVKYDPKNVVDSQFSLPFGIAMAVLYGSATPNEYTEETLKSAAVSEMMKKVRFEKDPALDAIYPEKWPASAEIRTTDGKVLTAFIEYPKGDPENPMSWKELTRKFKHTTRTIYDTEKQEKAIQYINQLHDQTSMNPLCELLN